MCCNRHVLATGLLALLLGMVRCWGAAADAPSPWVASPERQGRWVTALVSDDWRMCRRALQEYALSDTKSNAATERVLALAGRRWADEAQRRDVLLALRGLGMTDMPELKRRIEGCTDPIAVTNAALALASMGRRAEVCVPWLEAKRAAADLPEEALFAIYVCLANLGSPRQKELDALSSALLSDGASRREVAWALAHAGPGAWMTDGLVQNLSRVLGGEPSEESAAAAVALATMAGTVGSATPALRDALERADPVRHAGWRTVLEFAVGRATPGRYAPERLRRLVGDAARHSERCEPCTSIARFLLRPEDIPDVVALFDDTADRWVPVGAVLLCGETGIPARAAERALLGLLRDSSRDEFVRSLAAWELGALAGEQSTPELLAMAASKLPGGLEDDRRRLITAVHLIRLETPPQGPPAAPRAGGEE